MGSELVLFHRSGADVVVWFFAAQDEDFLDNHVLPRSEFKVLESGAYYIACRRRLCQIVEAMAFGKALAKGLV
jgi:hypothetical protein